MTTTLTLPSSRGARGFSLIELATTIVVLTMLAAAGFYTYTNLTARAQDSAATTALSNWARTAVSGQDFSQRLAIRVSAERLHASVPVGLELDPGCAPPHFPSEVCGVSRQVGFGAFALAPDSSAAELTTLSESGRCLVIRVEATSIADIRTEELSPTGTCPATTPPPAGRPSLPAGGPDSPDAAAEFVEPDPSVSGPGNATTLPGRVLHLDASAEPSLTLAGTAVTRWSDQSGAGLHATAPAAANRPTWSASAFNGRPGVVFSAPHVLTLPAGTTVAQGTQAHTVVAVFQPSALSPTSVASDAPILFFAPGRNYALTIGDNTDPSAIAARRNTGSWSSAAPATLTAGQPYAYTSVFTPGQGTAGYLNGALVGRDPNTAAITTTTLGGTIGSHPTFASNPNRHFQGVLAELIVFDRALTSAQLAQLQATLTAKWGLPNAAAVTPPVPATVAGLAAWYDADHAASFTYGTGTQVATWRDRSGYGHHLTQPTASARPTRDDTVGPRTAVRFNGSSQWLSTPALPLGEMTVFAVVDVRNAPGNSAIIYEHSVTTNSNDGFYLFTNDNASAAVRRYPSGTATTALRRINPNWAHVPGAQVTALRYGGTQASLTTFLNSRNTGVGRAPGTQNPGATVVTQPLFVGARAGTSAFVNGAYAELLVYNRALSDAEVATVNAYLHDKWGVSTAFHPGLVGGLDLWLDADDASTFTYGTGTQVATWRDKSGWNNHASQSTAASRPTRVAGAVNNRAAVRFNQHVLDTVRNVPLGTSDYAVFVSGTNTVPDGTAPTRGGIVYGSYRDPSTFSYGLELHTDRRPRHWWDARPAGQGNAPTSLTFATPTPPVNAPYTAAWFKQHTSGRYSVRVNGVSSSEVVVPTPNVTSALAPRIGADHRTDTSLADVWYRGDIGELLVYTVDLTPAQRAEVDDYLRGRWGSH